MRGRKPKPTQLRVIEGNAGKRGLNKREPKPKGELVAPPADLPAAALPFWQEAIADAPKGLLRRLDQRTLVIWSTAAWLHSNAAKQLATSAAVVQTKDGNIIQHPSLAILNKQAMIMLKAAAEMGFTPSSRSRVQTDGDEGGGNPFDKFA